MLQQLSEGAYLLEVSKIQLISREFAFSAYCTI